MRDLLSIRDRLADPAPPTRDRDTLVDRLSMFAELAEERCQRLRDQIEAGETISRTLRAEVLAAGTKGRRGR
jgi:hypothetical protein